VVLAVQRVRAERLLDVVEGLDLLGVIEVRDAQPRLDLLHALVAEHHRARLLVDGCSRDRGSAGDDLVDLVVFVGRFLRRAADE